MSMVFSHNKHAISDVKLFHISEGGHQQNKEWET